MVCPTEQMCCKNLILGQEAKHRDHRLNGCRVGKSREKQGEFVALGARVLCRVGEPLSRQGTGFPRSYQGYKCLGPGRHDACMLVWTD